MLAEAKPSGDLTRKARDGRDHAPIKKRFVGQREADPAASDRNQSPHDRKLCLIGIKLGSTLGDEGEALFELTATVHF
jgi:hypothetical protein